MLDASKRDDMGIVCVLYTFLAMKSVSSNTDIENNLYVSILK